MQQIRYRWQDDRAKASISSRLAISGHLVRGEALGQGASVLSGERCSAEVLLCQLHALDVLLLLHQQVAILRACGCAWGGGAGRGGERGG